MTNTQNVILRLVGVLLLLVDSFVLVMVSLHGLPTHLVRLDDGAHVMRRVPLEPLDFWIFGAIVTCHLVWVLAYWRTRRTLPAGK
jgi:hypothetical protein